KVIDLTEYSFSSKAIYRRLKASSHGTARWMNLMRAVSSEGWGRIRFYRKVRENLVQDRNFRKFFEGESKVLPDFYSNIIKKDLGNWWPWLPQTALLHNPNAYLDKTAPQPLVH
ncbi:MAG TPA: hypothetical protein VMV20_00445, partial [Chitinophagaceae bacterium]|nr:hypothetical protein [Chitinophagaceae bacterium]